jgi:hypothetical protein
MRTVNFKNKIKQTDNRLYFHYMGNSSDSFASELGAMFAAILNFLKKKIFLLFNRSKI